ncbi:MAG TPA: M28 family peptidase [Cyclobacteriaceae bacterium]|nr:M28 family peptidase [Cyclobacteriaceae bacterium]
MSRRFYHKDTKALRITKTPFYCSMSIVVSVAVAAVLISSCGSKKTETEQEAPARTVTVPVFNSDSAFHFVETQVGFGPRIPNTPAHKQAGDYFVSKLKQYGAAVIEQEFEATTFDGKKLFLRNIIGSYSPEKQKRILLAAHWDTRPFSDRDPQKPMAQFDGANDGASGVAVLLEIARAIKGTTPDAGVDIILFDGEDWGEKYNESGKVPPSAGLDTWWCLGSQYWSKHKHKPNYTAYYGILLDMVGAKGSHFFKEGGSMQYAPRIVEKVWSTASRLGQSSLFVNQTEAAITDDHIYINEIAKIPTIDIVHFDPVVGYFGQYHHTQADNLSVISKDVLGAVGTVMLNVIYYEE